MPLSARAWLGILLILFCITPLHAQRRYRLELSGAVTLTNYSDTTDLDGALGGVFRAGYWFYGPLSAELEGSISAANTTTSQSVGVTSVALSALWNLSLGTYTSAYLKAGYAGVSYGGSCPSVSVPGSGPCGNAGAFQGGGGVRIPISPIFFLRGEVLVSRSTLDFTNLILSAGVSVMLGSKPLADTDRDRVFDRSDKCPGTPPGVLVDKRGCPTDTDRDGVSDGIDRCPNTPLGSAVDQVGCTGDSDADGVVDAKDRCQDTPRGATVDENGCPSDNDNDGVPDGLDRCSATPTGALVDALGCPGDGDNDGVLDGLDTCPETAAGTVVTAFGCPPNQDSDGDGVRDSVDRCPDTAKAMDVDPDGCPLPEGAPGAPAPPAESTPPAHS